MEEDPLVELVDQVVKEKIPQLLENEDFIELLQIVDIPGACSEATKLKLADYFQQDQTVSDLLTILFQPPELDPRESTREVPHYKEYKDVHNAHAILCMKRLLPRVITSLFEQPILPSMARGIILGHFSRFTPMDCMIAEAFARFFEAATESLTVLGVMNAFGYYKAELIEGLTFQVGRFSFLNMCSHIYSDVSKEVLATVPLLPYQLIQQLFPEKLLCPTKLPAQGEGFSPEFITGLQHLSERFQYDLANATCELLTNCMGYTFEEAFDNSLAAQIIYQYQHDPCLVHYLVDAVIDELMALPTLAKNESYGAKVLNSLLQLSDCGCVAKLATLPEEELDPSKPWKCQNGRLNPLWSYFLQRLPELLQALRLPPYKTIQLTQIQIIYLLYPVVKLCCFEADHLLMQDGTMGYLLTLIPRFPSRDILHCAIGRLFLLVLEDGAIIFDMEMPIHRQPNDPFRLSLFQKEMVELLIQNAERKRPLSAMLDLAISYQLGLTQNSAIDPAIRAQLQPFCEQRVAALQAAWEPQADLELQQPHSPSSRTAHDDLEIAMNMVLKVQAEAETNEAQEGKEGQQGQQGQQAAEEEYDLLEEAVARPMEGDSLAQITPLASMYDKEEVNLMEKLSPRGQQQHHPHQEPPEPSDVLMEKDE